MTGMRIQPVHSPNVTEEATPVRSFGSAIVWQLLVAILATGLAQSAAAQLATPTPTPTPSDPANKPAVAINRGAFTFAESGQTVRILREVVKTSKPTDLLLAVTAETSIITDVTTTGDDMQETDGAIRVFVTLNGQVIHPAGGAPGSQGHPTQGDTAEVVFANQGYRRETTLGLDDTQDTIRTYLKTKHASAFNWAVLNAGSGTHVIEVWARYDEAESPNAHATGVIGSRSLVVQPVKCQVDETVVDGTDPNDPVDLPIPLN